ncbi:MAG: TIGR00341 family protein [Desulfobacteraceae bacterium]|nr:TIGR00341 family protein [Desulfobacteraceae bacterium]
MELLKINRERFKSVHSDISEGSEPALRFYVLVAVSTLIASFGLISNSTAVVIGAMLVAPLMTPIFGISLALVRGEPGLLGRALRAEIVGVVAAVAMGFILGSLLGDFDPTNEMLSRTLPNLFDLLVALLAGFAGAYALVDEKISPALPGVAIATAIVPPLANSGLCLALGEVRAGLGSFLLFFANFLSILIIASATFIMSGMAKRYGAKLEREDYARRFGLPVIAFVLISVFLGHSLIQIYQKRAIAKTVKTTLNAVLSNMPATLLDDSHHYVEGDTVHIMASVHSPKILTPTEVARMQTLLSQQLGMPAELVVHNVLSHNVSSLGSVNNIIARKLDGTFTRSSSNETLQHIAAAEQVIRDDFAIDNSMDLIRVEYLPIGKRKFMLAHAIGFRLLDQQEIKDLESRVRKATGDDAIHLVFNSFQKSLRDADGTIRYGWIMGDQDTPEIRERVQAVRHDLSSIFDGKDGFELQSVNTTYLDGRLHFLLEIAGPELYPGQSLKDLESLLSEKYGQPMDFYAWSHIEAVRGPNGPLPMREFWRYFQNRQKETLPKEIPAILEASSQ